MAQSLVIQNSKEIKHIHECLEKQYGFTGKLDVAFLLAEKKEKLYIFTRDLAKIDISRWKIDSMGLYFGSFFEGKLRLTIEGTQIIGKECTKNIIEITKTELDTWMQGEKLLLSELTVPAAAETGEFVILKFNNDYVGCGKIGGDLILNYIPKTRYIHATYDSVSEE